MDRFSPQLITLLTSFRGAQPVEREPKRDTHQPAAEAIMIAEPVETLVSAEQRLLRNIFGIRSVAQYPARNTKS